MEDWEYIAVEGVIGVGKTTLAKLLAREYNAKAILEDVDGNPFLPQFYEDPERYAFPTQIFFLLSRYNELRNLTNRELFTKKILADYIFEKDKIFAYINLERKERSLYDKIFNLLYKDIIDPDFVIYLQANLETIVERIQKRGRAYEKGMQEDYIKLLIQSYNEYFFHFHKCPILIVNANEVDFIKNPSHFKLLKEEIESIKSGINYFSIANEGF
ncbi:MAG: deoxynucleoside kinase [candidate division WOR-3 bacterium]|nr:deoxynucleoside kinase [candidate division WOR-3 bacterium]